MARKRCASAVGLAVVALWSTALLADDLPKLKAGLWESRLFSGGLISSEGSAMQGPPKQCLDDKIDIVNNPLMGGKCHIKWKRVADDRLEAEADCKLGNISTNGKSVLTGDFNSKVRIETTSTTSVEGTPAGSPQNPIPKKTRTTVIEARWIGPCAPDQQPGDVILSDGKVIHMPATAK